MARLHLFEVEDFPRCPRLLRDTLTNLLRWMIARFHIYEPTTSLLEELLARSPQARFIDLCSGGAGPWPSLAPALARSRGRMTPVLLTDLYPNRAAFRQAGEESGGLICGRLEPVDATHVPPELEGVRTIFSAFHHFRPDLARRILCDAALNGAPIGVFEFTERSLRATLPIPLLLLLAVVLSFVQRPFRWARVFWSVVLPLYPLVIAWDGFVSNMRTYSPGELRALVADIEAPGYGWKIGKLSRGVFGPRLTYLIGYRRTLRAEEIASGQSGTPPPVNAPESAEEVLGVSEYPNTHRK